MESEREEIVSCRYGTTRACKEIMLQNCSANLKRSSTLVAILVLTGLMLTSNAFAKRRGAVQVSIHASPSRAVSGQEIKLFVSVKNRSDSYISVVMRPPGHVEDTVEIEVYGPDGKTVPRIPLRTYYLGSGPLLGPRKTWTDYAILTNLFDLSKPGRYRVRVKADWVSAWGPSDGKSGARDIDVKSNTITFTVTPKA